LKSGQVSHTHAKCTPRRKMERGVLDEHRADLCTQAQRSSLIGHLGSKGKGEKQKGETGRERVGVDDRHLRVEISREIKGMRLPDSWAVLAASKPMGMRLKPKKGLLAFR